MSEVGPRNFGTLTQDCPAYAQNIYLFASETAMPESSARPAGGSLSPGKRRRTDNGSALGSPPDASDSKVSGKSTVICAYVTAAWLRAYLSRPCPELLSLSKG